MGLLYIGIILLVIGLLLNKYAHSFEWAERGGYMIIFGFLASLMIGTLILTVRLTREMNYQDALYEKKMIEYRIEHKEENLISKENLYQDIVDYNNKLRREKYWSNNFWVGAMWNDKIAIIDFIELEGIDWG